MKKTAVIGIVAAAIILAVLFVRSRETSSPESANSKQTEIQSPVAAAPSPGPSPVVKEASATASAGGSPTRRVIESAPTLDKARDEVGENPHVTPKSLISFARELGPRMEMAMKSSEAADTLFTELEECAGSPRGRLNPSAQALCLVDMRDLAKKYPDLRPREKAVSEKADAGVLKLAR
jgi:hypothetical protein